MMSTEDSKYEMPKPRSGRPKDQKAHQAILDAALQLMTEKGYGAVTFVDIARQAGVGRQTIYRRWTNKGDLYFEVLNNLLVKYTATLQAEIVGARMDEVLAAYYKVMNREIGDLSINLLVESHHNKDLEKRYFSMLRSRRDLLKVILLEVAKEMRGHFVVDVDVVLDMVLGIMWYRRLFHMAPLDDELAREVYGAVHALIIPD